MFNIANKNIKIALIEYQKINNVKEINNTENLRMNRVKGIILSIKTFSIFSFQSSIFGNPYLIFRVQYCR